ncbi:MAG: helix-turn-helix domain-containing protein [Pseudohongiella nitratireducens]|nr:helix-turn-helix domain-containing protein [Pseudohongiella nitratireducens]
MTKQTMQSALQSEFSTKALSKEHRFLAWQEGIRSLFEVELAHDKTPGEFQAQLSSTLLDRKLLLSRCTTSAQLFTRGPLKVASDGIDYYLIQTHSEGTQLVSRGNSQCLVRPGDVLVIDLAEPHRAITSDFSHLSLIVPRQLLSSRLNAPNNQHCRVLNRNNPLTKIVVSHLHTLEDQVRCMPLQHLKQQIDPILSLLACAMNSSADKSGYTCCKLSEPLFRDIKEFIELHLGSALNTEVICKHFHLSRSTLYRLFEPVGGVRRYIRERRLRGSLEALITTPHGTRLIDIACEYGFRSEAHFSRTIRLKYGITPSTLRALNKKEPTNSFNLSTNHSATGDRHYEQWLNSILKAVGSVHKSVSFP